MRILLIGVSVRAVAESAHHSGYDFVALDAFGDLDLRSMGESYALTRDFQMPYHAASLYTASQQLRFDGVAYTANLENYPDVVKKFARRYTLLGNSPEVLKRVRDWPRLFEALSRADFRTPETIFHGEERSADRSHLWLRKPVRSGGGRGVSLVPGGRKPGRGYLLQEYIEGQPCSASFIANGREAVVIGMTEQIVGRSEFGAQDFRYCGNLLPLDLPPAQGSVSQVIEQVQRIASLLTREFSLVGANGLDFMLKDGEVVITEVNPRYSASMELVERAYHLPVFDLHVRAITESHLPEFSFLESQENTTPAFYGKAILFAGKDGSAPDTETWLGGSLRDIPHPGEQLRRGKPICTLLASGTTREECYDRLLARAEGVKGEIYAGSTTDFNHRPVYETGNWHFNR